MKIVIHELLKANNKLKVQSAVLQPVKTKLTM